MRFNAAIWGVGIMALALAGCAKREAISEEELQRPVEVEPVVPEVIDEEAAPDAGDGAQAADDAPEADGTPDTANADGPILEPVTFAEIVDVVQPGLGCSFINGDDESLLFATGEDGPSKPIQAAVKIDGTMVPLIGRGGYSALEGGTTLSSEALEISIDRAAGEGEKVGIETLQWTATMIVSQDEGGSKSYEGRYSCGA
jgi:hypothetical protein